MSWKLFKHRKTHCPGEVVEVLSLLVRKVLQMSAQLDQVNTALAALKVSVDALVAKPATTVPEDLSAPIAAIAALQAEVDAAVAPSA